jgi:NAD+ synthase
MADFPQVAIGQINFTVGDIAGNSTKIINAWEEAVKGGAELVIFPELCVTGYSPQDLILMPDFRQKSMDAVQKIAKKTASGAAIILGSVWETGNKIHNAAILADGGEILHIQPKTILPNYGVFDEKRLFSPGEGTIGINWRGHKIAVLVCEDLWDKDHIGKIKNQKLEAVFVINASPFEIGKYERRIQLAKDAAAIINARLYYANLIGGQDELVFDGGSFVVDAKGKIISRFERFKEKIGWASAATTNVSGSENEIWGAMQLGLADYVKKNGFSKVLLGLSGGIDSALTAALAVDALGADNVLGVLMPSPYSSKGSIDDAKESARLLGIKTKIIPISTGMETFEKLLTPEFGKTDWMENAEIGGNLQARLRAVILMGLSNNYGSLLLSTGNKSEIAVGYSTLYGDSCGAYNVLKDIYKTQVYKLANWRNTISAAIPENSIKKAPSAELKPGQRDDDNLPPYDILDEILKKHIEGRMSAEEIASSAYDNVIVEKIIRLVRLSEYKRSQACPGVKISPMLFGKDRRFPITNKF